MNVLTPAVNRVGFAWKNAFEFDSLIGMLTFLGNVSDNL